MRNGARRYWNKNTKEEIIDGLHRLSSLASLSQKKYGGIGVSYDNDGEDGNISIYVGFEGGEKVGFGVGFPMGSIEPEKVVTEALESLGLTELDFSVWIQKTRKQT